MPSDHKKNKKAQKTGKKVAKPETEDKPSTKKSDEQDDDIVVVDKEEYLGSDDEAPAMAKLREDIESMDLCSQRVAEFRSVTGVLASHKDARDLHIRNLSVTFHGKVLLSETSLELNNKNRYGFLGANGCGKSTLFAILANREVEIPAHFDIFLLQREMPPSNKTALEAVMEVDSELTRLEEEVGELSAIEDPTPEVEDRIEEIFARMAELDADVAEKNAGEILHGLGFTKLMQNKQVKNFSGGWRMRISLARALFVKPAILLLDEPTNHLDLAACVWLEERLKNYPRILVVISHSQDFLNGVCTNIINMRQQKIFYYKGDFDTYVKTRAEQEGNQMKLYKKQEADKAAIKEFVAKYGHGTKKMARQAQSREKLLAKIESERNIEKVVVDKNLQFSFPNPDYLAPPVVQIQGISFRYDKDKPPIYTNLDLGVDLDTRAALVGPNGAGKSTLLKLICGELDPTDGMIKRHSHVRFGRYHQHLNEKLDMKMTPLDWMQKEFPHIKERDDMRKRLGRYGITGEMQTSQIMSLSDGQRCRIIFCWLSLNMPSILLLDEPTNHLDIETIDSLAEAINEYSGGMLLVSHDFRLIDQVADELWVCENQTVTKWQGDIYDYKKRLIKEMEEDHKSRKLTER